MPTQPPLTAVRSAAPSRDHPNLGPAQRLFSIAAGVALVIKGLRHKGPIGIAQAAVGLGAAWRGYTGVCKLTHQLDQTAYEHFMQKDAGWSSSKAVSRSVTINRPRGEVFAFFLSPENLAPLMPWVQSAQAIDEHSSRWTATGPLNKQLSWTIKQNVIQQDQALQCDTVDDPSILNPRDVIIRVTLSSVCGSDLHLLGSYVPSMQAGDIIGHEFLGEVVETGSAVTGFSKGDRVITISIIGCGECEHCKRSDFSCCDNSNPNPSATDLAYGQPCCGIIGYSHAFGGYAGSHATYIRVPFADVNVFKVPESVTDEQAVFVSDAAPTGYFAADQADILPGDTVAVWGCGAVGLMAISSAWLLGAGRVIAIDRIPERLRLARQKGRAEVINYETTNVHEALLEMTGGRGPDRCIDCVGMEAHGTEVDYLYDKTRQLLKLHTERGTVLRQAIRACRKGGTVSIVGVYGGLLDKFPMGAIVNKSLTLRSGQQPGQRYAKRLFEHIEKGELDTAYLLTHPMNLEDAVQGYARFKEKSDHCLRAVFKP